MFSYHQINIEKNQMLNESFQGGITLYRELKFFKVLLK